MNHWFLIALGDAMFADSKMFHLESQLKAIYEASGQPENMAALYRHESGGLIAKCSFINPFVCKPRRPAWGGTL